MITRKNLGVPRAPSRQSRPIQADAAALLLSLADCQIGWMSEEVAMVLQAADLAVTAQGGGRRVR